MLGQAVAEPRRGVPSVAAAASWGLDCVDRAGACQHLNLPVSPAPNRQQLETEKKRRETVEREKEQMMREKEELMLRLQDYEQKTKKAEKGGFAPSARVCRGALRSEGRGAVGTLTASKVSVNTAPTVEA